MTVAVAPILTVNRSPPSALPRRAPSSAGGLGTPGVDKLAPGRPDPTPSEGANCAVARVGPMRLSVHSRCRGSERSPKPGRKALCLPIITDHADADDPPRRENIRDRIDPERAAEGD